MNTINIWQEKWSYGKKSGRFSTVPNFFVSLKSPYLADLSLATTSTRRPTFLAFWVVTHKRFNCITVHHTSESVIWKIKKKLGQNSARGHFSVLLGCNSGDKFSVAQPSESDPPGGGGLRHTLDPPSPEFFKLFNFQLQYFIAANAARQFLRNKPTCKS